MPVSNIVHSHLVSGAGTGATRSRGGAGHRQDHAGKDPYLPARPDQKAVPVATVKSTAVREPITYRTCLTLAMSDDMAYLLSRSSWADSVDAWSGATTTLSVILGCTEQVR